MTFDSFTASVGLSVLEKGGEKNINALCDVLNGFGECGPVPQEVIDFIESNIGKPVRILYTSYKGTIHRCNKSESGFYPGIQYPVYVKITESSDPRYDHAVGSVFEYGLDQIELI